MVMLPKLPDQTVFIRLPNQTVRLDRLSSFGWCSGSLWSSFFT